MADVDWTEEVTSARIGTHDRQPHCPGFLLVRQLDENPKGQLYGEWGRAIDAGKACPLQVFLSGVRGIVRDVVAKHKRFEHEPVRRLVARHATVALRVAEALARSLEKPILLWHPLETLVSLPGLEKRLGSPENGFLTDEGVSRERVPVSLIRLRRSA